MLDWTKGPASLATRFLRFHSCLKWYIINQKMPIEANAMQCNAMGIEENNPCSLENVFQWDNGYDIWYCHIFLHWQKSGLNFSPHKLYNFPNDSIEIVQSVRDKYKV